MELENLEKKIPAKNHTNVSIIASMCAVYDTIIHGWIPTLFMPEPWDVKIKTIPAPRSNGLN